MKNNFLKVLVAALCLFVTMPAMAQFNLRKAANAVKKTAQAVTLTDDQMAAYVKEYIDWMDTRYRCQCVCMCRR